MAGPSSHDPAGEEGTGRYELPEESLRLLKLSGEDRMKELLGLTAKWGGPDTKNWMLLILPHLRFVSADQNAQHPSITLRHTVQEEHCNSMGNMHGGCTATLFDFCTSMSLGLVFRPGFWMYLGVSRTLNTTYIRPIPLGEVILIECEILQVGKKLCALRGVIKRESDGAVLATCEHGKVNTDPPPTKL